MGGKEVKDFWLDEALKRAKIDKSTWHPRRGIDQNRPCVEASYNYYKDLFLDHEYLQWAGMARMIAPCFYAGFEDLDAFRRNAGDISSIPWALPVEGEARFANALFTHYEWTFLHMQKKIFEDQATMHEAYLGRGLSEIRKLYWGRIIDRATLRAWGQIDDGRRTHRPELIERGNRTLLFREQFDIIDRFYAALFRYKGTAGMLLTYLMTLSGRPSIPGARSYPEAFPIHVEVQAPLGKISLRTPLAGGDIAVFAHRWDLTDADTLPTFRDYVHSRTAEARNLIEEPIAQRMRDYRLAARARQLALGAIQHWSVRGSAAGGSVAARVGPSSLFVRGTKTVELAGRPTRASLEVPDGAASRTWMNGDIRAFPVEVRLPAGRAFRSRADAVVVLCPDRLGAPERLIIRLPAMNQDEAHRFVRRQSSEWAFPSEAVDDWQAAASSLGDDGNHYDTRVFTPNSVDFVQLEFQVAHHVREDEFVITAHFTWDDSFVPIGPESVD